MDLLLDHDVFKSASGKHNDTTKIVQHTVSHFYAVASKISAVDERPEKYKLL